MNHKQAEELRNDKAYWKLGVIYCCKQDPRVVVRNRYKLGWAWNFANPYTYLVIPIFIAVIVLPALLLATELRGNIPKLVALYSMIMLLLMLIADYIARGPR